MDRTVSQINPSAKEEFLPLYACFKEIRDLSKGLLSVEDYFLLVRGLQYGFGLQNREHILSFCKVIWLKPNMDEAEFENIFLSQLDQEVQSLETSQKKEDKHQSQESPIQEQKQQTKDSQPTAHEDDELPLDEDQEEPSSQPLYLHVDSREGVRSGVDKDRKTGYDFHFDFSDSYLPITERQILHNLRFIETYREIIDNETIDIPATIDALCRDGFLHEFHYAKEKVNDSTIHLFVDQGNAMQVFRLYYEHFLKSLQHSPFTIKTYYFSDYPDSYVFSNRAETEELSIFRLPDIQTAIVFSDAGALAEAMVDSKKLRKNQMFLTELQKVAGRILWLNPVEEKRWQETAAAKLFPEKVMFEFSDGEFRRALQAYKGGRR